MAAFSFNTESVEKRENNFELLPAGWYVAQVSESEIAPLKSGNGEGLRLTFEVLADQYRGRKVWANLNVRHSNPEAERISQQQLRELCDAIGIARITDTQQLHNRPVEIRIKVREDKTGRYEPQNEVAGFRAARAGAAPASTPFPPIGRVPSPAPAPAAGSAPVPPWVKTAA
jgi:hypothetical protein